MARDAGIGLYPDMMYGPVVANRIDNGLTGDHKVMLAFGAVHGVASLAGCIAIFYKDVQLSKN